MVNSPNLDMLRKLSNIEDPIKINQIFSYLINELKSYLKLDAINKKIKIHVVDEILNKRVSETKLSSYGVNRYLEGDTYNINLFKNYRKYFPFLLLQSAYLAFIPNNLKKPNLIDFAINQFVEIDLQEFASVNEWKLFIKEKYMNYNFLSNQSDKFRFDKFLKLQEKESSESPIQFFFEYIRRNPNLNFDDNLQFFLNKMYDEFMFKSSNDLQSNEITETLRILTKIFYRIKNCDNLEGFCSYFNTFKKQGVIQTDLSLRRFKKNLRWINKYSYITPTYYYDWKAMDIAMVICYLKFNPLLEKAKIDKIINQLPFLIMPKLSITNFAVELSAYFVIPKVYLKDLIYLLEKMEEFGYFIKKYCSLAKKYVLSLNLNYFREFYKSRQIINPNNKNYSKDFELEFALNYNKEFCKANLSLLDFLILERIRFFSFVGLHFSRTKEISKVIKSDFSNFLISQNSLIKKLENMLKVFIDSPELKKDFLSFLERNQNFGFFYIKDELEKWINYLQIIEKESKDSSKINNFEQFKEFIEKENILQLIEESKIFENIDSNSYAFKILFLNYLNSSEKYEKEAKKLRVFYQFLKLCSNLKIFNITSVKEIINDLNLLKKITNIKRARLRYLKKNNKSSEITSKTINPRIEEFVNNEPKLIKPYLIDSVWTNSVSRYFPQMLLKNSSVVRATLSIIKNYFPKIYFYETLDLFNNQELVFLQLFIPYLNNNEKKTFISILSNIFKENIISFKRYSWNGLLQTFSRIDFYDFNKKEFFYSKDLFKQYFLYIRGILGEELKPFKEKSVSTVKIWSKKKSMAGLIGKINQRIYSESISFNTKDIQDLLDFHLNLEKYFMNEEKIEIAKKKKFFKLYVKSIKFFPTLQNFGLGQYFLYITPFDLEEIDFKLLLTNTFQKIKHLASIDNSNSLLIKYIFPYNDPNTSYLNWLRSKNKIREYCLFSVKKISQIFHFNNNLSSNGWYLDSNNFSTYIQNILFNSNYKVQAPEMKIFNIGDLSISDYYPPDSFNFKTLLPLYNWHSIDIKKKININNRAIFNEIRPLIKEKIIQPYINPKNLGFKEIIHIILLNLKAETIEVLKRIFQYFNLAFVYEIEGEYYIYGFTKEKKANSGLMIKLYLPDCELSEFLRIFEYVFQYLKVEKYLILTDLVNGDSLIRSVYGSNSFLKKYNPLQNLIWKPRAKKWINHKLFSKTFEYLYPELIFKEKEGIGRILSS